MKIEKVIFTIDDNPHYKSFWLSISRYFKMKLNFDCKLFVIGENPDVSNYNSEFGEVEFVKKIEGIPTIIQALIGKFYFTKTEPNTTWLVGDLDLYPLQHFHFKDSLKDISDDFYVHLNPHAYGTNWRDNIQGLAGYFHVAKGKIFEKELNFATKSFEDVCNEIYKSNCFGIMFHNFEASTESKNASNDWGWFCCEEMYTGSILKNSSVFIELPPINGYSRIDRSNMNFNEQQLTSGNYIDFHAPRPYENHQNIIEFIISQVPNI
jgi:hypothetical protein